MTSFIIGVILVSNTGMLELPVLLSLLIQVKQALLLIRGHIISMILFLYYNNLYLYSLSGTVSLGDRRDSINNCQRKLSAVLEMKAPIKYDIIMI